MAESAPAFQLYTKDFDTDEKVILMSLEQEGAYFRLLRVHWRERSIPADHDKLARLCRVALKRFDQHVWPGIAECFVSGEDGRLVNPRMARERARHDAFRAERAEAGKRGNSKRWDRSAIAQRDGSDELANRKRSPSVLQASSSKETATDLAAPDGTAQTPTPRETWLTPYCVAWKDCWGQDSEPPAGEMARHLRPADKRLGALECVARWRRFLAAAETSQFARPARFVQGLGEWAESTALATRAGPGRPRGVTAGNVEAAKRFLGREGGRDVA